MHSKSYLMFLLCSALQFWYSFELILKVDKPKLDVKNGTWEISWMKGVFKGQRLQFQKLDHPTNSHHSCYKVNCFGNHCPKYSTKQFCYPAIIVTGMPKCGTSAMYDLLSRFTGAVIMESKENCPYKRRRSHWQYFSSLPQYKDVKAGHLIIDGCIDIIANINMRHLLLHPKTLYIVMVRNYADMLWSSYNFWCTLEYDGPDCDFTQWVKPQHKRSPMLFHDIVQGDTNGTYVPSPLFIKRACKFAGGYYSEIMSTLIWNNIPRNETLVLASEELETHPERIWQRVGLIVGLLQKQQQLKIGNFTNIRINTQQAKGEHNVIPLTQYKAGLFEISGYQPMFSDTRKLLDKCWQHDCVLVSQLTGYLYPTCLNRSIEVIRSGEWRSFTELYDSVSSPSRTYNNAHKDRYPIWNLNTLQRFS